MFVVDLQRSKRVITDQGFLQVPGRLARIGIQEYYAFELGLDGDPMRRIRVYRPESEVFSPDAMKSFEDNPITINHPDEAVSIDNWKKLAVGHVRGVARDGDFLVAVLTITDRSAINAIDSGKDELSNGYRAEYDFTPGLTPDKQPYDAIQKNIRGNHVALVDAARCGPACRVMDSKSQSGAATMALKKITIDGLPLEFEESVVTVMEKLVTDRDTARAATAAVQTKLDAAVTTATVDGKSMTTAELATALTAANASIESMKKDVMTPDQRDAMVESWSKLITDAKRLVPALDTKGKTCAAIRREIVAKLHTGDGKTVIDAVLAGNTLDKATDDQIKTAFSVLAAAAPAKDASGTQDAVAQALNKGGATGTGDSKEEPTGRDAYVARTANAWQTPAK